MADDIEKTLSSKLKSFDKKIKNSFVDIRNDMENNTTTVNKMRDYLKKWNKNLNAAWKEEQKLREKLQIQSEEFEQKLSQLKIALSSVRSIKNELVVVRDLNKIEERVKDSFKKEIDGYVLEIDDLRDELKDTLKRLKQLEKKQQATPAKSKPASRRKKAPAASKQESVFTDSEGWSFLSNFGS